MHFYLHSFSDRIFLITLALLAAVVAGGALHLHRVLLLDRPATIACAFFAGMERKLNRPGRAAGTRRLRGVLLVVVTWAGCMGVGWLVGGLSETSPWGMGLEVALLTLGLPIGEGYAQARSVQRAFGDKENARGFALVAPLARRDDMPSDMHMALRSMVEYLALHFSRRTVAPVFWYVALGLPAMLFVAALGVMDRTFGSRASVYASFGAAAARLDDIAQIVPARIAALLFAVAASCAPGCNPGRALRGMAAGAGKTVSPNNGVVLGAVAGALGVALAGPRAFKGVPIPDAWIDFGTAKLALVHLARMNYLYLCAVCLLTVGVAAMNIRDFSFPLSP